MSHASLRERFRWRLPDTFNLGIACSDEQLPSDVALISEPVDGPVRVTTFAELTVRSNRLAAYLHSLGIGRGDRVGVIVPQSEATGLAHLAIWKIGGISVPIAPLFGSDAVTFRLTDAAVSAVITSPENRHKLMAIPESVPIITTDGDFDRIVSEGDPAFPRVETAAEDPAYLIYTSGTTGPPKGALHAHRSLHGHLPGFELYYEFAPQTRDVIWTPADWAWIGGLMDVLIPAWYFGMTVLTAEHDFEPHAAVDLMVRHAVTLAFIPPTALKMMRAAQVRGDKLQLRAVFSGGEPLGEQLLMWSKENLGVGINEGYGQTECNLVLGNCESVWPVRAGSMGRALPGHEVAVLDEFGQRLVGEVGEICVRSPDPVMMLHYWNRPDATSDKVQGDWMLTGDLGIEDDHGYFWFVSRKDDVINSMGYRIGPGEIEDCLLGHPDVAMCAVVGVHDDLRGQVPAAYVVLKDAKRAGDELVAELQDHVRTRLAAHEVPRQISFVEDLPRTTSGKIVRRALRVADGLASVAPPTVIIDDHGDD